MPARPGSGSVVEFLLQDEALPRTVASCLAQVRQYLKELPHNQEALEATTDASMVVTGTVVTGFSPDQLQDYLATVSGLLAVIHQRIESALFGDVPIEAVTDAIGRRHIARTTTVRSRPAGPAVIARYGVLHRSTYQYDEVAEESHNEVHLRPRNTVHQRVLSNSIDITPLPETRSDLVDQLGNHVTTFVVRGHFQELSVTSTSEVERFATEGPPTGPPWESVCLTLDRDRRLGTRSALVFRSPSRLVPTAPVLAAYAAQSFGHHRPVVEAVGELCSRIHADFTYEPGFTSVTTPLLEVFEARRGVCQDFAHLAVGCLRSVGLAARYVSGYIETVRPDLDQLTGADASHAWTSTYLPGWGWLDLDPTNDLIVCQEHVTTAWGRDYQDVSPLRGSVAGGGRSHALNVAVEVTRID
jgi:transglutaminase-like putative cysteine protease